MDSVQSLCAVADHKPPPWSSCQSRSRLCSSTRLDLLRINEHVVCSTDTTSRKSRSRRAHQNIDSSNPMTVSDFRACSRISVIEAFAQSLLLYVVHPRSRDPAVVFEHPGGIPWIGHHLRDHAARIPGASASMLRLSQRTASSPERLPTILSSRRSYIVDPGETTLAKPAQRKRA